MSLLTWGAEEADVVVGAVLAPTLLPVETAEALLRAEVHHLADVLGQRPLGGPHLDGGRPGADPLPVVELDGLQGLKVAFPAGVVHVEPRSPFPWKRRPLGIMGCACAPPKKSYHFPHVEGGGGNPPHRITMFSPLITPNPGRVHRGVI